MDIEYELLGPDRESAFAAVADGVFDHAVNPDSASAFLADPHHHIAVARAGGQIVAFVSALTYLHPDKPLQCWINELSTAGPFRRRGIAAELMRRMIEHARSIGCAQIWVATEGGNYPARSLYRSLGGHESEHVAMYEF